MEFFHTDPMISLVINFIPVADVPRQLNQEIESLDRAAFSGETDAKDIQWASPGWMALGFLDKKLVSQLCLLKREILIGGERVWVAGVGGVATSPNWQRHGFASQVLRASEVWMRDELKVPFGLLVCADQTQHLYARCGWQVVAQSLIHTQGNQRCKLDTCVMILGLNDQQWPVGEIDCCGLPW